MVQTANASDILGAVVSAWRPPSRLTVSEWSDQNRILSVGSAEPGRWRTARAPYLKGIMDAINDPSVKEVWWMKSAQVGATEALNNIVGYFIHQDPGPILVMQPTVEMGQSWSKERLQPMIRDCPALSALVAENKSRDSGNTIMSKSFAGGRLDVAGANSAAGLASRPKRIILCDETDRYPPSAGNEGDPINLGRKRSTTFWNRVFFAASTPTVKGLSRIETGFESGDQRRFHVPCPDCGELQHLKWENLDFSDRGTPQKPVYICEHCNSAIDHKDKPWMIKNGEWRSGAEFNGIASFHINELYSPWSDWAKVVDDFLRAKKGGPEQIKTWKNTSMGETYEEAGDSIDAFAIQHRAEQEGADGGGIVVPDGGLVLTVGCDVQRDRLEAELVAWGRGLESWSLAYEVFQGDVIKDAHVWARFEEFATAAYLDAHGDTHRAPIILVDSGDGVTSDAVMEFCRTRMGVRRGFIPIKGSSKFDAPDWTMPSKPKRGQEDKINPYIIGSSQIKLRIYDALKIKNPGPGYMHFPSYYPETYFRGLTAERLVTVHSKGWPKREWHKTYPRNEPLDIKVYNYAAIKILNPDFEVVAQKIEARRNRPKTPEIAQNPQNLPPRRTKKRMKMKGF